MKETQVLQALAALAQEHRLRIFRLLVREGPDGMTAGVIAERAGISATSTSFHMKELEQAGLVGSTRDGRFIRYAIDVAVMRDLLTFLTEDCCQGRPELCGAAQTVTCKPKTKVGVGRSK
jgi:DNA-binding transcriptional ArsR family regulator